MKAFELKKQIVAKEQEIAEKREALEALATALETRDLNDDENAQFDSLTKDVAQAKADIADLQSRVSKLESIEESEGNLDDADDNAGRSLPAVRTRSRLALDYRQDSGNYYATREYQQAWMNHIQTGDSIRTNAASFLSGTQAAGGYAIAPVSVSKKIVTLIDSQVKVRNMITKFPLTNAVAFRVPKVTANIATPAFGTEGQCLSPDLTAAFAAIDLTPTLQAQLLTLSLSMLNLGGPAIVDFISNRLAYLFATAEESQILTGNGSSGNFLGAFVASANGIPTSQDTTTATSATLVGDDLITAVAKLDPAVISSASAAWVMHPTTVAAVRKLKDSQNRYLWEPSLGANNPDTLLGIPVISSMFAPTYSTVSGSYVAVLGDWSYYYEASYEDAFTIQRLSERYADCGLIGLLGRRWLAGSPVRGEAFTRLKIQ